MEVKQISINKIIPDKNQPRKYFDEEALERLTTSIKEKGIEQPIAVKIVNDTYVIVDGERRFRASQGLIDNMPCIVFDENVTDNEILEYQLRTDCLKEELLVDELDRAIYRYYEQIEFICPDIFTSENIPTDDDIYTEISKNIGNGKTRIRIAVDRFKFKQENQVFYEKVEKKYNPENRPYSKVNSTIAMTDKLKGKPEVRKEVIEKILDERKNDKLNINNDRIDRIIGIASKTIDNPEEVKQLFDAIPEKNKGNDPNILLMEVKYRFYEYVCDYDNFNFESVKNHLRQEVIDDFINEINDFLEKIVNLGEE